MNLAARLVLRAGRPARSARAEAAAARRSDGPPARIRRRARSRPHARLPAQHEGQLDVPVREDPRPGVGPQDGPHAVDHGLLALQLRRAARGRHCRRRPDSRDRALRHLGHDVGLHADPRRADSGRREADARQVGARAGRQAVAALLDRGRTRLDPGEETEAVGDADAVAATTLGVKNLQRVSRDADAGHDSARRTVRRPGGAVRPHAGPVGHRDEPRRPDRRRVRLAAETHRAGRRPLHSRSTRQTGRARSGS